MSAAAELLGRWTKGCVRLIEPVQFLYSLYLAGSMSLVSQSVRFLVQNSRDPAGVDPSVAAAAGKTSCRNGSAAADAGDVEVEAEAARWLIYMNLAAVVPALFSTVFLGGFSNRVGRKLVLLLPLVGGALRLLFFITVFTLRLSLAYLVVSSFVDGLFGMSCSMLMACFSYASDITTHQQRSIRLVLLQMFSGLALITSNLVTGFVIHSLGHVWMFVFLLGILAIAFCYIVFFLQESFVPTPPSRDHSFLYWAVEPFVSAFTVFRRSNVPGRRCCLSVALLVSFLVGFVQLGRTDPQILYLFTYPFCFNSVWIGYYNATFYLVVNIAMILATWTLGRFVGDIGLVFIGTFFGVTYELMFGFAVNKLMIFLGTWHYVLAAAAFGSKCHLLSNSFLDYQLIKKILLILWSHF